MHRLTCEALERHAHAATPSHEAAFLTPFAFVVILALVAINDAIYVIAGWVGAPEKKNTNINTESLVKHLKITHIPSILKTLMSLYMARSYEQNY